MSLNKCWLRILFLLLLRLLVFSLWMNKIVVSLMLKCSLSSALIGAPSCLKLYYNLIGFYALGSAVNCFGNINRRIIALYSSGEYEYTYILSSTLNLQVPCARPLGNDCNLSFSRSWKCNAASRADPALFYGCKSWVAGDCGHASASIWLCCWQTLLQRGWFGENRVAEQFFVDIADALV